MRESGSIDSIFGEGSMPKPCSLELRERVVEAVESGASRREAAHHRACGGPLISDLPGLIDERVPGRISTGSFPQQKILEDEISFAAHVRRAPRLGDRGLLNVRIGISNLDVLDPAAAAAIIGIVVESGTLHPVNLTHLLNAGESNPRSTEGW